MREFADLGLGRARASGADYADIRICHYRNQDIRVRDQIITALGKSVTRGFGIRTLYKGAWGFASSSVVTEEEIERIAALSLEIARASLLCQKDAVKLVDVPSYEDKWQTPFQKDPFQISIDAKKGLLLKINEEMLKTSGIKRTTSFMSFTREEKYFASTMGSHIEQVVLRTHCGYRAVAVGERDFQTRSFEAPPLNTGYEHIEKTPLLENARRVAEEAVEKLSAAEGPAGVKDLVLSPSNLSLTIHESIGHATELDRVLGQEADYAGTSFATVDNLNKLQYGSRMVNILVDRDMPAGRATVGYDDDGVKTGKWYIIKEGLLVGYSTNRELAAKIGQAESRGCNYADSWRSIPIIRMPNVSLEPGGKDAPTPEELIADTKDGIFIDGRGSWSIDHQRRNFQFGGDAFWEIKDGKRTRMLKNVTYRSDTVDFWNSCDAVCGKEFWEPQGVTNCGKGQPPQRAQQTHGASPARFRNINVGEAR
jgi:TldD protein